MGTTAQTERLLALETPLGPDILLPRSLTGVESISSLFRFELEMVAEKADAASVKPVDLIGQPFVLQIALSSEYDSAPRRHINGVVNRFVQGHSDRRFVHYRAELVPWLWLATLTADCRIFQEKSVPEIVEALFGELRSKCGSAVAWRNALTKTYPKLDYCVQFRETTYNFVSRLMESEGIAYFFEHDGDNHTLVLADTPTTHKPCPDQPEAIYVPAGGSDTYENMVSSWEVKSELRPGKYTMRDFHMQLPSRSLEVVEPTRLSVGNNGELEVYDYPGLYADRFNKKDRSGEVEPEGTRLVKLRMEEMETPQTETSGESLCRGFLPGFTFKLSGHYDKNANGKYLITSVQHTAVQTPSYVAEEQEATAEPYQNTFSCIPSDVPFRPTRKTLRPVMQGPQTAIVVGPPGEEIHTDEFSRVKIQFHWDREGSKDDKSSCWVRVSQPWAGQGWGGISIPRIGQEVVVDFVDGDPDQPIIVGRVYNAESMPPFALPADGMVSGMKSNSTPGGGGYNEISMNDTKGKELFHFHAQYDMTTVVEHDETHTVHNNRTVQVDVDHKETVGNNQTISIGVDQKQDVGANQTETVGANRQVQIGANDELTVGANRTMTIGANLSDSISVNRDAVVGVNDSVTVGASQSISVGASQSTTVGASISITAGANITISCGASSITLTPAAIMLQSPMIKLN